MRRRGGLEASAPHREHQERRLLAPGSPPPSSVLDAGSENRGHVTDAPTGVAEVHGGRLSVVPQVKMPAKPDRCLR